MTDQYHLHIIPSPSPHWSGAHFIPKIGDRVHTLMNNWGNGTVTAYFVEGGYLGIHVEVDSCPPFYLRATLEDFKKGRRDRLDVSCFHFFGIDIEPTTAPPPPFTARHQLAVLFLKSRFRNWRQVLSRVWMDGSYTAHGLDAVASSLQQLRNAEEGWHFVFRTSSNV